MTFGNMINRVSELINQSLADDTKTVTLTEVKANLNRAYHKIANKISTLGQDYYYREAKADLVASQSLYGLPTDMRRLERIEIDYAESGTRRKARRIDRNAINDPAMGFSQDGPYYAITGNMFELFPTPTASTTGASSGHYGIHIWYLESVSDMSGNSDEPSLPDVYQDLPIEYAVAKAKERQGLIEEANEYKSEFYGEVSRLEEELIERNEDDNASVIIRDEY